MFNENPFESATIHTQTGGNNIPKANTPSTFFNPSNKSTEKYNIINIFWLINPKVYTPQETPLLENEQHFCAISFNVGFNNLRIELSNMTNESIINNLICLDKIQRNIVGTVYPTAMLQLITASSPEVICYEQILKYTGEDWQKNRPVTKFSFMTNGSILCSIDKFCYEFSGYQKEAILGACKFGLSQGLLLSGMNNINK